MHSRKSNQPKYSRIIFLAASVIALAVAALTNGCTWNPGIETPETYSFIQDVSPIFTTRPSPNTHAFFLVKLQSAPLMAALDKNGAVDTANLKAIDKEQTEILGKIQALSSDINVVYRYRMVLNGFAIVAPIAVQEKIAALGGVAHIEAAGNFARPVLPKADGVTTPAEDTPLAGALPAAISARNSVKFIGAEAAHARGIRGQGLKVGIIDTGIDYTHAMFGGAGTEAAFKAVKPGELDSGFPNAKVVGGIDLVGTTYNSAAVDFKNTVPLVDQNPIDEGGHGTHVAGTVAGKGDGKNTYDGVAPDALLYALKVFGAEGSTGDTVVIAAMEFAADPNGDGDLADKLDVVNLSLGSGYGSGHILYSEAIRNLSTGGTAVVASGGNSGDTPYIVGSPGSTEEAISVAASVDDMDQNWKFRAAKFTTVDKPEILVDAIEGNIAKPLKDCGHVAGELVYVGLAKEALPADFAQKVAGKIAFIDRGSVTFVEKIQHAQDAGAIGVVIANNQPGEPIQMGSDDKTKFTIPAIMVTLDFGKEIKEAQTKGAVTVELTNSTLIERPELIDTMAGFSSKGPRSIDALLKPEISSPGSQIISAKMGGGTEGTQMSGTSMAAPHMAGVIALLKQTHPKFTPAQLKSMVMSTAKTMVDKEGKMYPIARQGAGRVQVMKAIDASITTIPSSISLGEVTVESRKTMQRRISIANISSNPLKLAVSLSQSTPGLTLTSAKDVALAANAETVLDLRFTIDLALADEAFRKNGSNEISGFVLLTDANGEVARVPVIAIANKVSQVRATELLIRSTSQADSQGAVVDLTLANASANSGDAYPFNLIARDARKNDPTLDPFQSKFCDLESSGYRVIQKNGVPTLQVAAKIYEPMTTWDLCEVSVLIDSDSDREADQELAGIKQDHLEGLTAKTFASVLIDGKSAREIRKSYEAAMTAPRVEPAPGTQKPKAPVLNYTPAIVALTPMPTFDHSTIAILEVAVSDLKLKPSGDLAVRVATSAQSGSVIEPDDFLSRDPKKWKALNVSLGGQGYTDLPEKISLAANETKSVSFTKGAGQEPLLLLYPSGRPVVGGSIRDAQSEVSKPRYLLPSAGHAANSP